MNQEDGRENPRSTGSATRRIQSSYRIRFSLSSYTMLGLAYAPSDLHRGYAPILLADIRRLYLYPWADKRWAD
jgi:hypothetical protein